MAANKLATMLHRNTNKIIAILVYAVLEWVLILLLLLNSLFSYLITKFARLVGLKPPCPWCSRIDHILDPRKGTNLQRDIVCEAHAAEISNLGFCSNHGNLAETERMCEDCLASQPNHLDNENSIGMRHRIAFLSWVSHSDLENGENVIKRCSCCSKSLSSRFYPPPCLLMKPSWGDGDYASKGTLIVEAIEDDDEEEEEEEEEEGDKDQKNNGEDHEHQILSDIESYILREVAEDRSSSVSNLHSDEKDEKEDEDLAITEQDRSVEVVDMNFEKYEACDTHRLIPVGLIDYITCKNFGSCDSDEGVREKEEKIETFASESQVQAELVTVIENAEKKRVGDFERFNISMTCLEDSIVLEVEGLREDSVVEVLPQNITTEGAGKNAEASMEEPDNTQDVSDDAANLLQSQEPICSYECTQKDESSTSDDDTEVQNAFDEFITQNNLYNPQNFSSDGVNEGVTIGDSDNAPQGKQPQSEEPAFSCQCVQEDQSSTSDDDAEVPNAFDEFIAQNNLCANDNEHADMPGKTHEETSHQSPKCSEANEVEEEDKLPETPSSVDDLHYRRLLGAEESVDESGDPVLTIELLKTALKTERKALSALYQELEEERSASAIAANQTMAMITRLQEEKAAMQMEALQYQRMMEEQSEYDQEALQLLNELMTKREKEKQELEKELEECRQKVIDYEAKEKLRTCSNNNSDSDELSIDLNKEAREEDDTVPNLEEMALDCVKQISALDDSLAEFEEERVSILDQLKALEEKLITLGEKENLLDEGIQMIGDSSRYEENSNGFSDDKEYSPRRTMDSLAKRLLPEFERQFEAESVDHVKNSVPKLEMESKKVSIEEEVVDHVYERLKAIETYPLENGDKGNDLLQEVFQHLRDLKAVELRLKNLG